MKRIYVAGAYSATDIIKVQGNMRRGLELSIKVLQAGFAPFCPWLDFQFGLLDEITLQQYYDYSLAWLEVSDALLVVQKGWQESKGTLNEIEVAEALGLPIFHDFYEMVQYFKELEQNKNLLLEEIAEVTENASSALVKVMKDGNRKHPPFSWKEEDEDEHLLKSARHILTHMLIKKGYQKPTGEVHLDNALTRSAMAKGLDKKK